VLMLFVPHCNSRVILDVLEERPNDYFGYTVGTSGNRIVVGAHLEDSNDNQVNGNEDNDDAPQSGAAYVYETDGTTWSRKAFLKASNAEEGDQFGFSVSISGDTIVVGAPFEDSAA
jgi:hypothetical protein